LLYGALLWFSRQALITGRRTHLSHAIAFLADDYHAAGFGFCWELFDMTRKLILSTTLGFKLFTYLQPTDRGLHPASETAGWVLLIQDAVEARVLMALLVSVTFLALHLLIRPIQRCFPDREPNHAYSHPLISCSELVKS
jgi:hypothetical protein